MAALAVWLLCLVMLQGASTRAVDKLKDRTCPAEAHQVMDEPERPYLGFLIQTRNMRERVQDDMTEDTLDASGSNLQMVHTASRTCDPAYSGFSCVSGFTAGACRTSTWGAGLLNTDFVRVASTSPSDCASQCAAREDCRGFESAPDSAHCEIWTTLPAKTSSTAPWICRVKDVPADSCAGEASYDGFSCISGFEKGACRTATLGYGATPDDWELTSAASASDCAVQCAGRGDCVAFEASLAGSRCELWKALPAKSSQADGWVCRVKTDSPTTTTTTSTTTVTTTTKVSVTSAPNVGTGKRIEISGTQLLVDGESLHLKGVNWSPVKKGWSPPWGLDFTGTVEADSLLMQQAGINAVRTYEPLLDITVLDKLWSRGIYVLNTVYAWGGDAADVVVARVNAVKDHPAILMWVIGNEWNYNGFYVGLSHDAATVRIREAALLIKQHDTEHPVSTIYGEIPSTGTLGALSDIDIWGINAYRGGSFGDLFNAWASHSQKPMYLGEYGADAWDAVSTIGENQVAQAYATTVLTQEIVANSAKNAGVCLGGIIFSFNDEWWKDGSGSPWTHDVGGIAPGGGPYPDLTFNEEWWGLVDLDRSPRQAYYAYKNVHSP